MTLLNTPSQVESSFCSELQSPDTQAEPFVHGKPQSGGAQSLQRTTLLQRRSLLVSCEKNGLPGRSDDTQQRIPSLDDWKLEKQTRPFVTVKVPPQVERLCKRASKEP